MPKKIFAFALALLAGSAVVSHAADETVPFPTDRSQILRKQGTVYTVTGRQTIPAGVELSCQKDIRIRGAGPDATIVVDGSFRAHGVTAREIIFDGVRVEPGPKCKDLQLDMCIFRGGGVFVPKERPIDAKIHIENCTFESSSPLDIKMQKGEIDLINVTASAATYLTFVDAEGTRRNSCKVNIQSCDFDGGLFIENGANITVRLSAMGGGLSQFTNNDDLMFDGNKITSSKLAFLQTRSGKFGKTKIMKCDIYSSKLIARAPKNEKTSEKITVDKCWFRGKTREKELRTGLIQDGKDDPENAAMFRFKKINERPLELAGELER